VAVQPLRLLVVLQEAQVRAGLHLRIFIQLAQLVAQEIRPQPHRHKAILVVAVVIILRVVYGGPRQVVVVVVLAGVVAVRLLALSRNQGPVVLED